MFGGVSFNPAQMPDLSGKIILVTGGNAGIGKEAVLQLAKHGPSKIFLAARSQERAAEAIYSIKKEVPDASIFYLPLDLASFNSVRVAANVFKSSSSRLDLLILNAGIITAPEGTTESGHDIQLGTNHLGHALLTRELLPVLLATAAQADSDVRVISVSSEAWNMAPNFDTLLSPEKLSACNTWARYGASKWANIIFAAELARRYPQLTCISIHPGLVRTDLLAAYERTNVLMRCIMIFLGPLILQEVAHGAYNHLWAAAGATESQLKNGAYYTPVGKVGKGNSSAQDAEKGRMLWEWTEAEYKKSGF